MERRVPLLVMLAAMGFARAVGAAPATSYAEFSYQEPDHGDRGAAFRAAATIGQRLVLDFGVDAREHRDGGVGLASLGLGTRLQTGTATRFVVGLSAEALGGDFGADDEPGSMSGLALGAGFNGELSHRLNDRVELLGRLKVTTIDGYRMVAAIGARFYLARRLAVVADVLKDELGTRVGVGMRLDFSRH